MKTKSASAGESPKVKKGYNEKNPGQHGDAFPPDANKQKRVEQTKSNAADKKAKEARN